MSGAPSFQGQSGAGGAAPTVLQQAVARGRQLYEAGDLPGAEAAAQSILAQRPKQVEATQLLAAVAAKRDDAAGAIRILRGALTGGPSDASLQMNLCRMLRHTGALDEARAAGEVATAIGSVAEAHADLADVYLHLGLTDQAIASFERAIAKTPNLARAHLGFRMR